MNNKSWSISILNKLNWFMAILVLVATVLLFMILFNKRIASNEGQKISCKRLCSDLGLEFEGGVDFERVGFGNCAYCECKKTIPLSCSD